MPEALCVLAHVVDEWIDSKLSVPALAIFRAHAQMLQRLRVSLAPNLGKRKTHGWNELPLR